MVQVQQFGTRTRYKLEILHQYGERVKSKSKEILWANSYVCRRKTGRVNKRGGRGIKINRVSNIFAKFDKQGGWNLNKFVNIANE